MKIKDNLEFYFLVYQKRWWGYQGGTKTRYRAPCRTASVSTSPYIQRKASRLPWNKAGSSCVACSATERTAPARGRWGREGDRTWWEVGFRSVTDICWHSHMTDSLFMPILFSSIPLAFFLTFLCIIFGLYAKEKHINNSQIIPKSES